MKKSNLLLLIAFTTGLLLLAGINLMIYNQYKSGNYTTEGEDWWATDLVWASFAQVKVIDASNINSLTLHAGDTTKFGCAKTDRKAFSYQQKGDTLIVKRTTGTTEDAHLYFKEGTSIKAKNTDLSIANNKGKTFPSLNITMDGGELSLNKRYDSTGNKFGTVQLLVQNKAYVDFHNSTVQYLTAVMRNSTINLQDATVGTLQLQTDSLSKLQLNATQLKTVQFANQ